MNNKKNKKNTHIVSIFQKHFEISSLFVLCSQLYCKQPSSVRKKYQNLCGQLQLFKARYIHYKKEQNLLQSGVGMLAVCIRQKQSFLQSFQVAELIMMLKLLSEWKKSIQLCFDFLKQVSQKDWRQLRNPIISHISQYLELVQSILYDIFNKKGIHHPKREGDNYKKVDTSLYKKSSQLQWQSKDIDQQLSKQYNFRDLLKIEEKFTYKTNSIILQQREKKSPVKVSTPKKYQKQETKSAYVSNIKVLSQKIKEIASEGQKTTKNTTQHKALEEKIQVSQSRTIEEQEMNDETQKQGIHHKRQWKSFVRHKSTIQSQINFKPSTTKSPFKSSNRLSDVSTFTTNPYQTSSQITYSSNSKAALKSNKPHGKDPISQGRVSKKVFRKSLLENLESKKVSQNKGHINLLQSQQLEEINESKHNISQSQHSEQQLVNTTQQNIEAEITMNKKTEPKDIATEDFCSSKSFKNQRYKRRFGLSNNVANSLRSLDRIQSFLSGDSKKQIKKLKTENRPSFFRSSGLNIEEKKSQSIKGTVGKISNYKMKLLEKKQKRQDTLNDSEEQQKKAEKMPRRFQTEVNEAQLKMNMADIKDFYKILTEINVNEQNEYNNHPDYYHQLFKRKYSNHQNNFDYDSHNRPKPFKIKVETTIPDHIVKRPNVKNDSFLIDFMSQTIKSHQGLSVGQRGLSEIY